MLFSLTLMMSITLSISSMSWFTAWVGLEMNLMSIMPLMKNFKNKFSSEATIKYFITQAIASMILLFSILIMSSMKTFSLYSEMQSSILSMSALFMKMGAAPLHFWLPQVVSGLTWNITTTILTLQKMAPMILVSYMKLLNSFTMMVILLSASISGMLGLNQTCLRKIMAFSSINNVGWMLSALMLSNSLWMMYFIIYSFITMSITLPFNSNKMMFITQLTKFKPNKTKLLLMMNFLSLGGIPPFTGFMPKWMTIHYLSSNMFYMTVMMIMLTLITLYMYIRLMLPSAIFTSNSSMNLKTIKINNTSIIMSMVSLLMLPMLLISNKLI
uniref:NADH-ubiquinone oxidoreductase chain 2 n=1 Tax=Scolytinae sp. BMNH 1274282 TaxID=2558034 RepID=A0A126TF69_9CUCU|nr:NADH dehydrogenase subunit 2 [Scolytinae sp. BMNH 1274282]